MPLQAAFFLGPGSDEITITPIRGAGALEAWMQHSFVLDIEDTEALAAHFDVLVRFCAAVPSYRLNYARRFDEISRVRAEIAARLTEASEGSGAEGAQLSAGM